MSINENINAQDNGLAEIEETIRKAAADISSVEVKERTVLAEEKREQTLVLEDDQPSGDVLSKIQRCGTALGGGSNRFKVGADMATDIASESAGLPSLKLVGMAVDILSDRGSIFKSVESSIKGKPLGYNAGATGRGGKLGGIKTAHFNDIAGRVGCIEDFTQSGVKGVQAAKGSAPSCKQVKDLVIGQRMANKAAYDAAMVAKNKYVDPGLGSGARARTYDNDALRRGPGFIDPRETDWGGGNKGSETETV